MNIYNSRFAHFFGHHTYYEEKQNGILQCKYCHKVWDVDRKIKEKIKAGNVFIVADATKEKKGLL